MRIKDKFRNLDQKLLRQLNKRRLPSLEQFKFIWSVLNNKEAKIIKLCSLAIAISLVFLGIRFYYAHLKIVPARGGNYAEGVVGYPTYINPVLASGNDVDTSLTKLIFRGLLKKDENGKFVNDLAQSIEVSPDQKIYKIKLKQGLKWHDGSELNADDVIFTFQSVKDPSWQSPLQASFRNIEIEKMDDKNLTLRFKKPFAQSESLLATGIIPSERWTRVDSSNIRLNELNLKPIGSGPYKFLSLSKDKNGRIKSYTLEAFNDYQGEGPFLEALEMKFYSDEEEAMQALSEGNIDGLALINHPDIKPKNKSQAQIMDMPRYTALFLNLGTNKFLKNKSLRQAIAQSINAENILDGLRHDQIKIINSPILDGMIGYDSTLKSYAYSPSSTQAILSSLGWSLLDNKPDEEGKIPSMPKSWQKNNEKLSFIITTIDKTMNVDLAGKIKNSLEEQGVKIDVEVKDPGELFGKIIRNRDFDILLFSEIFSSDPDPLPFWHSSQVKDPGLNISMYQNPKVDSLLEQARMEFNTEKRAQLYKEFQKILLSDVPAIFLYQSQGTYYLPENIKGFGLAKAQPLSSRFENANKWYVKTKKKLKIFN